MSMADLYRKLTEGQKKELKEAYIPKVEPAPVPKLIDPKYVGMMPTPAKKYEPTEYTAPRGERIWEPYRPGIYDEVVRPYLPTYDPKYMGGWNPDYHIPQIYQRDPAPQGYYAPPRIEEPYNRWKKNLSGYVPIEIARLIQPVGNLEPPEYSPVPSGGDGGGYDYYPKFSYGGGGGGGSSRVGGGYGLINWRIGV